MLYNYITTTANEYDVDCLLMVFVCALFEIFILSKLFVSILFTLFFLSFFPFSFFGAYLLFLSFFLSLLSFHFVYLLHEIHVTRRDTHRSKREKMIRILLRRN